MKPDDDFLQLLKELGVEGDHVAFEQAAKRFGLGGLDLRRSWNALAARAAEGDDWDEEVSVLFDPYDGPVAVEVAGPEIFPDPFRFVMEFAPSPSPMILRIVTENIAAIAQTEATNNSDHVSNWSEAVALPGSADALHRIQWHLDVAAARPATIRRVIEATAAFAATLRPMPIRLIVGDPSERTSPATPE